ncbi:transposase [Sinorhizobium chiapasense]|uniref:Transposase n=1 Tax=Sinorhizobium chiapasense TaxID=501572 RepID=A0ABZ2BHE8_9HYPH
MRRLGLPHTRLANASCGTIRLKLLKIGAQVRVSVHRIKVAMASACPYAQRVRAGSRPNTCHGSVTPPDPNPSHKRQRIHC